MSPTEELFGAYHFLVENHATQIRARLRTSGLQVTDRGLTQFLKGQPVALPSDRVALAKLLVKLADPNSKRAPSLRR